MLTLTPTDLRLFQVVTIKATTSGLAPLGPERRRAIVRPTRSGLLGLNRGQLPTFCLAINRRINIGKQKELGCITGAACLEKRTMGYFPRARVFCFPPKR